MSQQPDPQRLVAILQLACSGELAAAYAYRGHWHSLTDADERTRIENIENEGITATSSAKCCAV